MIRIAEKPDLMNTIAVCSCRWGKARNEVNERLKRLAPEMFESTDKQVKEE